MNGLSALIFLTNVVFCAHASAVDFTVPTDWHGIGTYTDSTETGDNYHPCSELQAGTMVDGNIIKFNFACYYGGGAFGGGSLKFTFAAGKVYEDGIEAGFYNSSEFMVRPKVDAQGHARPFIYFNDWKGDGKCIWFQYDLPYSHLTSTCMHR